MYDIRAIVGSWGGRVDHAKRTIFPSPVVYIYVAVFLGGNRKPDKSII